MVELATIPFRCARNHFTLLSAEAVPLTKTASRFARESTACPTASKELRSIVAAPVAIHLKSTTEFGRRAQQAIASNGELDQFSKGKANRQTPSTSISSVDSTLAATYFQAVASTELSRWTDLGRFAPQAAASSGYSSSTSQPSSNVVPHQFTDAESNRGRLKRNRSVASTPFAIDSKLARTRLLRAAEFETLVLSAVASNSRSTKSGTPAPQVVQLSNADEYCRSSSKLMVEALSLLSESTNGTKTEGGFGS